MEIIVPGSKWFPKCGGFTVTVIEIIDNQVYHHWPNGFVCSETIEGFLYEFRQ